MKIWPIIRHARYFYYKLKFNYWWNSVKHIWITPNPKDLEFLEGVWKGEE